jgi:hypothetical protein
MTATMRKTTSMAVMEPSHIFNGEPLKSQTLSPDVTTRLGHICGQSVSPADIAEKVKDEPTAMVWKIESSFLSPTHTYKKKNAIDIVPMPIAFSLQ